MSSNVQIIPVFQLTLTFIPCLVVLVILYKWSLNTGTAIYSMARMVIQLVAIGFVLAYLFKSDNYAIVMGALTVMLAASSWIALRPLQDRSARAFGWALAAIALGGVPTLLLVTQAVLALQPWYLAEYMIPLAGMVFANAMNTVSLAAERLESDSGENRNTIEARRTALNASLIPSINTMFAVGLVSLPGMMTGQILSGVSPLIAVRYQIMVMFMLFGSSGIAAATFLILSTRQNRPD